MKIGAYFDDFEFKTYDEFILSGEIEFFLGERVKGVYFNDILVGIVSKYWESEKTRWLEIGIVIYDKNYWNGGFWTKGFRKGGKKNPKVFLFAPVYKLFRLQIPKKKICTKAKIWKVRCDYFAKLISAQ